eukprot:365064-Chlamydomonas_euryale.AAC.2
MPPVAWSRGRLCQTQQPAIAWTGPGRFRRLGDDGSGLLQQLAPSRHVRNAADRHSQRCSSFVAPSTAALRALLTLHGTVPRLFGRCSPYAATVHIITAQFTEAWHPCAWCRVACKRELCGTV